MDSQRINKYSVHPTQEFISTHYTRSVPEGSANINTKNRHGHDHGADAPSGGPTKIAALVHDVVSK